VASRCSSCGEEVTCPFCSTKLDGYCGPRPVPAVVPWGEPPAKKRKAAGKIQSGTQLLKLLVENHQADGT
jgi:hypothetical protein